MLALRRSLESFDFFPWPHQARAYIPVDVKPYDGKPPPTFAVYMATIEGMEIANQHSFTKGM
jgi:hypothetical protein